MTQEIAAKLILLSTLGMGLLHFIMFIWLYVTRIPAFKLMRVNPNKADRAVLQTFPKWAKNPADNYNNLYEAPTVFYGVSVAIVLLSQADLINAGLSIAYVLVRLIHSLYQSLINKVTTRFVIFALSWIILGALIVRNVWLALQSLTGF